MKEWASGVISSLEYYVWVFGIKTASGEEVSLLVLALLASGLFLTFRLGFLQFRFAGHSLRETFSSRGSSSGVGDVSQFQALSTALSGTVGIGNIAGVAIAIHWGGPGAIFWMWVTAVLGMALKFTEVTLAHHFRRFETESDAESAVLGGPMLYIEAGLGKRWKPMAVFVATALMGVSLLGANAAQSNAVADVLATEFGFERWVVGLGTSAILAAVLWGGI